MAPRSQRDARRSRNPDPGTDYGLLQTSGRVPFKHFCGLGSIHNIFNVPSEPERAEARRAVVASQKKMYDSIEVYQPLAVASSPSCASCILHLHTPFHPSFFSFFLLDGCVTHNPVHHLIQTNGLVFQPGNLYALCEVSRDGGQCFLPKPRNTLAMEIFLCGLLKLVFIILGGFLSLFLIVIANSESFLKFQNNCLTLTGFSF